MTDKMRERVREFASETVKHFFVIGDGADKLAPWIEGQIITFLDSLEREQGSPTEIIPGLRDMKPEEAANLKGYSQKNIYHQCSNRNGAGVLCSLEFGHTCDHHFKQVEREQGTASEYDALRMPAMDEVHRFMVSNPKTAAEMLAEIKPAASEARIRLEATLEAREKAFDWFGDHAPQHCVTRDKELCGWCRGTVEIEAELAQLATTEREAKCGIACGDLLCPCALPKGHSGLHSPAFVTEREGEIWA